MHTIFSTLLLLITGHYLCDYSLQSDYIARNKSPLLNKDSWMHVLTAHAAIHCGLVYVVTNSLPIALAEFVCHWVIDLLKCMGYTTLHSDQLLHILCKILWVYILFEASKTGS